MANAEDKNDTARRRGSTSTTSGREGRSPWTREASMWRMIRARAQGRASMDPAPNEPHLRGFDGALIEKSRRRGLGAKWDRRYIPMDSGLGTLYGWQSNWFAESRTTASSFTRILPDPEVHQEEALHAGISKVVIERTGEKIVVNIHTARPRHPDREARRRGGDTAGGAGRAFCGTRRSSSTSRRSGRPSWTRSWWPRPSRCSSSGGSRSVGQ